MNKTPSTRPPKTSRRGFLAATAATLCLAATAIFPAPAMSAPAKPIAGVKHVVLVGFDGFGAYAWEKADNPNMKSIAARGALSLKTRSVLPSNSAPNWSSHLMGAGPELHGYTEWNTRKPIPPSRVVNENGLFPNIFWLTRKSYPNALTAAFYDWDTIHFLIDHKTVSFEKYQPAQWPKDVPEKKVPKAQKVAVHEETSARVADDAAAYIKANKPLLSFVYLGTIDETGHIIGHNTPEYYATVKKADDALGKVLAAIKEAGMEDSTVVILVSDHGGIKQGHGKRDLLEMETPWVIAGPGIKRGHNIDSVVVHYDTAPTIAHVLGLAPPQAWRGRPVLEAFKEGAE